jgi:hypothetical protein
MVILSKAGEDGLHTRALLEKFRSVGYGQVLLREAMQKGYVKRTPVKKEDKKGRGGSNVVINYITPAGKQYLREILDD